MSRAEGMVMVVAGTRPEVIKLAPVIEQLERLRLDHVFVWSGQHYDYELSRVFFEQLGLPEPNEDLDVRSGTHAEQTAKVMIGLEKMIDKYKPSVVVAEGDTNTVVATALAATKKLIPFAHVEAGLRSWDRTMPEEVNRVIADAVAEIHFAPTELAAVNLTHEGIPVKKIHITGNTIVDVVYKYREVANAEGEKLLSKLNIEPFSYILITIHRQENTDSSERLQNIVKALIELSKNYTIIFPIHPRTLNKLKEYGLWDKLQLKNIHVLKPLGYFQFLGLLMKSLTVLTDSGGVQEEACTLKIPTITLRYNTERPETVIIGINKVVGVDAKDVVDASLKTIESRDEILRKTKSLPNPLGDGSAGLRIARALKTYIDKGLEIPSFNGRISYPVYILKPYVDNHEMNKVIAMYDNHGNATIDPKKAQGFVLRSPNSYDKIYKELYGS